VCFLINQRSSTETESKKEKENMKALQIGSWRLTEQFMAEE
jgi:hypothetical protein